MGRTRSAFLGTASSQVYAIISVFVSLFSVPVIVKNLNPEIYGLSIIIFQITAYLGMFDFGLTAGVERYLAGTRDDSEKNRETIKRIISTSLIAYTVIAIIVIIAGNTFAPFAAKIFNAPSKYTQSIHSIISILSILLGFQIILRAITGIFFAHQRQILSNTISFILNLSGTLLSILFVFLGFNLWSFVYSQILVFVLNAILNIYFFRKYYSYISISFKKFDFSLVKEMFSYGFALFFIGIAVQIVFQTDRIIIGSFVSLTAVSIYSFATKIPELTSQIIWKITDNSFPGFVELSKKSNSTTLLNSAHEKIMHLTLSLSTTAFWIIILISYPFIKLWVGQQYYPGLNFIVLVAYLYLIQLTYIHVTSVCLNGLGIAKSISLMAIIEAAINLSLSIYLVRIAGIKGVILATIIAGILTSFWFVPYLAVKYWGDNLLLYFIKILKPVLICSVFNGLIYLLFKNRFNNINTWFSLVIYTSIVFILFLVPVVIINKNLFLDFKSKVFNS